MNKVLKKSTNSTGKDKPKERSANLLKSHPWRLCPETEYWRNKHVQNSYTKSDGTFVRSHPISGGCCRRPSGKDQLYSDEMIEIAKAQFASIKDLPHELPKQGPWFPNDPNIFDRDFAGWTIYWNTVMNENDPLDPNLVKALAASESMFSPKPKDQKTRSNGSAKGLFQLTDDTRKILANEKGELKDHYVHVGEDEVYDPTVSTAGAIRWLYHKRKLASKRLGRLATWDEAVQEYKGVLGKSKELVEHEVGPFRKIVKQLQDSK